MWKTDRSAIMMVNEDHERARWLVVTCLRISRDLIIVTLKPPRAPIPIHWSMFVKIILGECVLFLLALWADPSCVPITVTQLILQVSFK